MSADRQKFEVDLEVARMSVTIRDMIEGAFSGGQHALTSLETLY